MFKISKTFSFDMAHLLDGHDGKCQNLHGHTYTLEVELSAELIEHGPKKSMVADYGDIKATVNRLILQDLDHAFLYDKNSPRESAIAELLIELQSKVYALETRTTAEEIARFIYRKLKTQSDLPISAVRLWETPSSFCEYKES
ncbi:6-carboxytetrahydropterin synthase QueD [Brackiella oedipodis]|uniref:6-carboxytetrahydropterin synthase QueD n=1 Tax=Brackiella oedipodis TaxID=124225 RepID=UPI00048DB1FA|nr:6-carboxytetrahydropterin synthase QueD [Brackiella oedipodis]